MKLTQVIIEGFMSFSDQQELKLQNALPSPSGSSSAFHPRAVVVGENGSGKSNIVRTIEYILTNCHESRVSHPEVAGLRSRAKSTRVGEARTHVGINFEIDRDDEERAILQQMCFVHFMQTIRFQQTDPSSAPAQTALGALVGSVDEDYDSGTEAPEENVFEESVRDVLETFQQQGSFTKFEIGFRTSKRNNEVLERYIKTNFGNDLVEVAGEGGMPFLLDLPARIAGNLNDRNSALHQLGYPKHMQPRLATGGFVSPSQYKAELQATACGGWAPFARLQPFVREPSANLQAQQAALSQGSNSNLFNPFWSQDNQAAIQAMDNLVQKETYCTNPVMADCIPVVRDCHARLRQWTAAESFKPQREDERFSTFVARMFVHVLRKRVVILAEDRGLLAMLREPIKSAGSRSTAVRRKSGRSDSRVSASSTRVDREPSDTMDDSTPDSEAPFLSVTLNTVTDMLFTAKNHIDVDEHDRFVSVCERLSELLGNIRMNVVLNQATGRKEVIFFEGEEPRNGLPVTCEQAAGAHYEALMVVAAIFGFSRAKTIILDEPGRSFHPPLQRNLRELIFASQEAQALNASILVVTHSPDMLSEESFNYIYRCTRFTTEDLHFSFSQLKWLGELRQIQRDTAEIRKVAEPSLAAVALGSSERSSALHSARSNMLAMRYHNGCTAPLEHFHGVERLLSDGFSVAAFYPPRIWVRVFRNSSGAVCYAESADQHEAETVEPDERHTCVGPFTLLKGQFSPAAVAVPFPAHQQQCVTILSDQQELHLTGADAKQVAAICDALIGSNTIAANLGSGASPFRVFGPFVPISDVDHRVWTLGLCLVGRFDRDHRLQLQLIRQTQAEDDAPSFSCLLSPVVEALDSNCALMPLLIGSPADQQRLVARCLTLRIPSVAGEFEYLHLVCDSTEERYRAHRAVDQLVCISLLEAGVQLHVAQISTPAEVQIVTCELTANRMSRVLSLTAEGKSSKMIESALNSIHTHPLQQSSKSVLLDFTTPTGDPSSSPQSAQKLLFTAKDGSSLSYRQLQLWSEGMLQLSNFHRLSDDSRSTYQFQWKGNSEVWHVASDLAAIHFYDGQNGPLCVKIAPSKGIMTENLQSSADFNSAAMFTHPVTFLVNALRQIHLRVEKPQIDADEVWVEFCGPPQFSSVSSRTGSGSATPMHGPSSSMASLRTGFASGNNAARKLSSLSAKGARGYGTSSVSGSVASSVANSPRLGGLPPSPGAAAPSSDRGPSPNPTAPTQLFTVRFRCTSDPNLTRAWFATLQRLANDSKSDSHFGPSVDATFSKAPAALRPPHMPQLDLGLLGNVFDDGSDPLLSPKSSGRVSPASPPDRDAGVPKFVIDPRIRTMFFSKSVIFVEGENDFRLLTALSYVLETGRLRGHPELSKFKGLLWDIIPLSSKANAPKAIDLAMHMNIRFVFLLDHDALLNKIVQPGEGKQPPAYMSKAQLAEYHSAYHYRNSVVSMLISKLGQNGYRTRAFAEPLRRIKMMMQAPLAVPTHGDLAPQKVIGLKPHRVQQQTTPGFAPPSQGAGFGSERAPIEQSPTADSPAPPDSAVMLSSPSSESTSSDGRSASDATGVCKATSSNRELPMEQLSVDSPTASAKGQAGDLNNLIEAAANTESSLSASSRPPKAPLNKQLPPRPNSKPTLDTKKWRKVQRDFPCGRNHVHELLKEVGIYVWDHHAFDIEGVMQACADVRPVASSSASASAATPSLSKEKQRFYSKFNKDNWKVSFESVMTYSIDAAERSAPFQQLLRFLIEQDKDGSHPVFRITTKQA